MYCEGGGLIFVFSGPARQFCNKQLASWLTSDQSKIRFLNTVLTTRLRVRFKKRYKGQNVEECTICHPPYFDFSPLLDKGTAATHKM